MDSISTRQVRCDELASELKFLPLVPDTANEVAEIAATSFPDAWKVSDFSYFLSHPCSLAEGAWMGDKLVCYFIGLLTQGDLDIVSLATHSEYRKQRIAEALLRHLLESTKVERAMLEVDVRNIAAIRLYQKVGFLQMGIRKRYYANKHDAAFMRWERAIGSTNLLH